MTDQVLAYIRLKTSIVVTLLDGRVHTIDDTHPNWTLINDAINNQDLAAIENLVDVVAAVAQYVTGVAGVEFKENKLYWNGEPVYGYLVDTILSTVAAGNDAEPLVNHLNKLMDNPSATSVSELYEFLERGKLPICPDGDFLAYKYVTQDYLDCYTKTIDNSIGATPSMPRNQVDDVRDNTCSNGLHFCSRDYLPATSQHGGCRVVIVKVNPRDVVSIPPDHNCEKARCCTYEVVGELDTDYTFEDMEQSVYTGTPPKSKAAQTRKATFVEKYVLAKGSMTVRRAAKNLGHQQDTILSNIPDETYVTLKHHRADAKSKWRLVPSASLDGSGHYAVY